MVNISKNKLPQADEVKLFKQLSSITGSLKADGVESMFRELLTESEQVMLAKRLAVIVMIHEGCSLYLIWKKLHLSPSTVTHMYDEYSKGAYVETIKIFCRKKQDREKFWSTLELISRGGLPPMGKDRWKTVNKLLK